MSEKHDLLIIGSGSTAFAAALRARELGATVLMAEKSVLGGTCVNWGCIPSKTLIHAALFRQDARCGAQIGLSMVEGAVNFPQLMARKDDAVSKLRQTKYLDVLTRVPGIDVVKGTARFITPKTVQVGDTSLSADNILIAAGGYPRVLELPGIHEIDYLTSRSALFLKTFPASLIIIGGGVIALELGQMFCRLGTKVTILEHGDRLLPAFEVEPVSALHDELITEGLEIILGCSVRGIKSAGENVRVTVGRDGTEQDYYGERLLLAVGTAPASSGIGLSAAGVEVDAHGFIQVDEEMRTSTPGIWAAGDITGGMMIATVGAHEGITAAESMFRPTCGCRIDYASIPMAIFTDPELAMVGHGETAARDAGYNIMTSTIPVTDIPKAHITGHTAGAIKMVADRATGRVLGVHLSCHRGADLINEAALAIRFRLTVADLASTLPVYPTMSEGLRLCAQGFMKDIHTLSCCAG